MPAALVCWYQQQGMARKREDTAMIIDTSAYCMQCHQDTNTGILCDREQRFDNGADRDLEAMPMRYEGVCLRCCDHNHA